jgi:two-component sensor histidine kinase
MPLTFPIKAILNPDSVSSPMVPPTETTILLVSADHPPASLLQWLKNNRFNFQWLSWKQLLRWNMEDIRQAVNLESFAGLIAVGPSSSTIDVKQVIARLPLAASLPILWFHTIEKDPDSVVAEPTVGSRYSYSQTSVQVYFQSVAYDFDANQKQLSARVEATLTEVWQNSQRWRKAASTIHRQNQFAPTQALLDGVSELLHVLTVDTNGKILKVSPNFIEKYQLDSSQIIGIPIESFWETDVKSQTFASIASEVNENGKWRGMMLARINSQKPWFYTVILPHTAGTDSPLFLVLIRDLSQKFELQRQIASLEQNEEILRAELMHRMNNMQARHHCLFEFLIEYYPHPFVEAAGREFQELIQVEKLIYERLIHVKELARIHFDQLICAIINYYKESRRHNEKVKDIRFSLDYPDEGLMLNVDKAYLLAFILNIIISNAINHLALFNNYDKLISVSVKKQQTELMMIIDDNGIGFNLNLLREKTTFGFMQLDLHIKQLHARLEASSDSSGTRYVITWPL